jgi:hypothetical protein
VLTFHRNFLSTWDPQTQVLYPLELYIILGCITICLLQKQGDLSKMRSCIFNFSAKFPWCKEQSPVLATNHVELTIRNTKLSSTWERWWIEPTWISQGNSAVNRVCKSVTVKKLGSLCKKSLDTESFFTCNQQHHITMHWCLTSMSPRNILGSLDPLKYLVRWLKTATKKGRKKNKSKTLESQESKGFPSSTLESHNVPSWTE